MDTKLPPVHPGETLLQEFLRPMGLSQYRLAKDIGVQETPGLSPASFQETAGTLLGDQDLGTIEPGKLADLILVDGQPDRTIGDIRRVVLTVKGGVEYDPAALYGEIGVKPVQ
jgi:hypothetical protein